MEAWLPLFDIFTNSPSPEFEASIWLQQSFIASSSTVTTASFISLLSKPTDAILVHGGGESSSSSSSSSSPVHHPKRVMWLETLPSAVQSRILSFLTIERRRFSAQDLRKLARSILRGGGGLDFWVEKCARNLLDLMSEPKYDWISCLSLDSAEERVDGDFESLPDWLKDAAEGSVSLLPWLPVTADELNARPFFGGGRDLDPLVGGSGESVEVVMNEAEAEAEPEIEIDIPMNAALDPEIHEIAACLRERVSTSFESNFQNVGGLVGEIHSLCLQSKGNAFSVLGLIEPWNADDETVSVLLAHLPNGSHWEGTDWPSQVLCSVLLPKFLVLEKPASRVLMASTIDYCKTHPRAAVNGLVFPLILQARGINNATCDIISRVARECLHLGHVSAFCQNLLCGEGAGEGRKFICLPCHRSLISNELVWTEALFNLFQNILNHNVYLTHDSIDRLVSVVEEMAERFSKSLKFVNFLLCFVSKCSVSLKHHKVLLTEVAKRTNTVVTKSVLSKLASL